MPCRRLRNELDELPDEDACIGLTPRLDEELREDEEPVRPEEVLEVGDVLELLEDELGRDPPEPVIKSCIVA